MADGTEAAGAAATVGVSEAAFGLLTLPERKAIAGAIWRDRFTSLWAPVTIFGLVFAVYLVVIENATCSYLWLQPALKAFGFLMFLWWAGLVGARLLVRPFARERHDRVHALEVFSELEARWAKGKPAGKQQEDLAATGAEVLRASVSGDGTRIKAALEKAQAACDKHLGKSRKGGVFDFLGGFGKALLVALAIRTVLLEPFRIPSGSMIPTLEIGDQIFVNKFIYGVRIPFTNWVPFQIVRPPRRGDVIVFNNPVQPDKDFVKRIVGIPGDVVELKEKIVHVNGQAQPTTVDNPAYRYMDDRGGWVQLQSVLSRESLDGVPHLTLRDPSDPSGVHEGPFTVPERHVFVMGDNRDNSEDSRYGLGGGRHLGVQYVPYGNIKGKAMVTWLSLSHGGLFSGLFGGTGLRTDRFFTPVTLCGTEPPRI